MAIISLLLNNFQTRTVLRENASDADILPIDCTITRTTNFENEITQFPVEEGLDVTDHIRTKPITMSIEGIISETPLTLESQKAALVTSAGSVVAKQLGGFKGAADTLAGIGAGKLGAKLFQGDGNPAEIGRAILEKLALSKTRFRVAVGKKILDDMVISRLSIPEELQNGRSLRFSATLQQIRVVKGQTVFIQRISRSAAHTASKKTNLGAQATTTATEQQRTSLAKSFVNFLGGR